MKNKNEIYLTNTYYVIFLSVICCILWGSAFPVLKMSYKEIQLEAGDVYSKMVFAGIRFMLAAFIIFIVYLVLNKKTPKVQNKNIKKLLLLGIFNTALQYYFFYNGLANTSGIKGAVLASSGTFFVIIFAHFVYRDDKMNISKILGLLTGFIGIFIVNWTKSNGQGLTLDFKFLGEGFLICSGIVSAVATIYGKKLSKEINPIIMNGYQFLFGSSILLIFGLIGSKGYHLHFTVFAVILLIYSAFLSAVAFCIWYSLLKYNKATSITIYKFLIPVVGSILSAVFLPEEYLNIYVVIGLLFASSGIYLVNRKKA